MSLIPPRLHLHDVSRVRQGQDTGSLRATLNNFSINDFRSLEAV
jgi:hypothetical protein